MVLEWSFADAGVKLLAQGQTTPTGIAVDGERVYFATFGSAAAKIADGTVMSVAK